jgi:hypothetical protein
MGVNIQRFLELWNSKCLGWLYRKALIMADVQVEEKDTL